MVRPSRIILGVSIGLVLMTLLRVFLGIAIYTISGTSMDSNSIHDGGRVLTVGTALSNVDRYDIAILQIEGVDKHYVKRIIGLPGETVEIYHGQVFVNGIEVETNFLHSDKSITLTDFSHYSITLGDDEYFVLGDNRPVSEDSRRFGPVNYNEIKGIVKWVIH